MKKRTTLSVDNELAQELREFAEKKHGFTHGAVRAETEAAIRSHIACKGGGA